MIRDEYWLEAVEAWLDEYANPPLDPAHQVGDLPDDADEGAS